MARPSSPRCVSGLAGRIVDAIAPHTESDPVALLLQLIVLFGNAAGSRPHFMVEADRHGLNLYMVLVGASSKGTQSTALGHVKRLFARCDPDWADHCVTSGLSSGEGLIWAVRDADGPVDGPRVVPAGRNDKPPDAGVPDKRLLPIESEFRFDPAVLSRDGNVLSAVLRQAWECGLLRALTKNQPARATGAHISVVGHISAAELRRELTTTDKANGFGNRFGWACVTRSQCLPDGGQVDHAELEPLIQELSAALAFAKKVDGIRRDDDANHLWHDVYPKLSEGSPGLVGAMTARAEAQVMRIAAIYALLDRSEVITVPHLDAALALWAYCEASVGFIFRDSLGDPIAERVSRR